MLRNDASLPKMKQQSRFDMSLPSGASFCKYAEEHIGIIWIDIILLYHIGTGLSKTGGSKGTDFLSTTP